MAVFPNWIHVFMPKKKTNVLGAMIPVVAHIWHDCKYTRQNGVSITLVRMCRINCGERTEVLTKELATVTRDLNLQLRQGYSVQTLTESLHVPVDMTPTIPIECGVLAAVEYNVFLAVHAHPGALYTELPSTQSTAAMQYMLVEIPMYIDVQQEQPPVDSNKTADDRPVPPPKDTGTMKDRMKGMFRRRSKMEPLANANDSSISLNSKSTSIRQVMSTFRPRTAKSASPPSSMNSGAIPASPALSATSSVTDISNNNNKRPQQSTSSSTPSSPSILPPPPAYVESAPLPTQPASLPPPPMARAASIHPKDLPTINSVPLPEPAVPKVHDPIPGLEGGGVYTFHMFDDSDDEEPGPVSVSNHVADTVATPVTNDSNLQYFDMFPDSDDEGPAVQRQAVRKNLVYPDPVNKLDEVSESESDHDDSDEDSDDLLSIVKRREDRIERAKAGSKK
ncbi:hypothetical protein BJV82DRAFT_40646 [Fennellomyces sp. T-0311]|nr:hypothetical protein BJV82DRAFT_40646 [Fennellomyces sp. T-0311]